MLSLPIDRKTVDPIVEKRLWRAELRRLRRELSPEYRSQMSADICMHTAGLSDFLSADTVLGFYPIGEEPNILPILQKAFTLGKRLAFPRCHPASCTMTFHWVSSLEELSEGAYGIREPAANAPVVTDFANAFCLVPALGFDRHGYRIGYGKGYYDRFLTDFDGVCAGIGYSPLLCDALPYESTDKTVSMIITERGILLPDEALA